MILSGNKQFEGIIVEETDGNFIQQGQLWILPHAVEF